MKVRLYKPHTHAGVRHVPGPEGVEIDVDKPDAEFMKQAGVLDKPAGVGVPPPPASAIN